MRVAFILLLACAPAFAQDAVEQLGTVAHVTECRTGKYSLNCRVSTTTHVWETDVTDWPGNIVQRGDRLSTMHRTEDRTRTYWLCKNGTCRQTSTCYSWMPCWSKP